MRTNVLIVEDQYFSRLALRSVLESRSEFSIVGEAGTGASGVGLFRQHTPDITLVDLRLPDMSGVEVIRAIRLIDAQASIVVVSNFDDSEHKRQASEAGAAAFLNKSASSAELLDTITQVVAANGGTGAAPAMRRLLGNGLVSHGAAADSELTARECDVLEQLVLGYSNREIGARLGISEKAVGGLTVCVLAKLGVTDRAEAGAAALQRGLVERPEDFGLHG
jgi:DNA-binding NarL/FixJ family response regulator